MNDEEYRFTIEQPPGTYRDATPAEAARLREHYDRLRKEGKVTPVTIPFAAPPYNLPYRPVPGDTLVFPDPT